MSRRHGMDVLEVGVRGILLVAKHIQWSQAPANVHLIRLDRYRGILEKLLDFGSRREDASVNPVEQRTLAAGITGAHQPPAARIPENEGEVPEQAREGIEPPCLVGAQDDLGVTGRRCWTVWKSRQEVRAVIQPRIGAEHTASSWAHNRLPLPCFLWSNRHSGMTQRYAVAKADRHSVGSTIRRRGEHSCDEPPIRRAPVAIEDRGQPAHCSSRWRRIRACTAS